MDDAVDSFSRGIEDDVPSRRNRYRAADPDAPETILGGGVTSCDELAVFANQCINGSWVGDDDPLAYGDPVAPSIPYGGSCDVPNSFVSGTRVLMADGSTKAIEKVKIGDKVIATDAETGRTEAKPVTALITGEGTKHLAKITVDVDGDGGAATDTITATDNHPFWVPALHAWLTAGQLQPGMWLQTGAGTYVQITAVQAWTAAQQVHNLTVDDLHTYYVLAGATPVLVHNDNKNDQCGTPKGSARPDGQVVFAGHGGWSFLNGWTRVPEGTSLAVYGEKGHSISDFTGFRVELGDPTLTPTKVYGPGERIRNLQLYPPTPDLAILAKSTTVQSRTSLSQLLKPNMGMCHWAACLGGREP
ncbi:polymorphic toxin-type HINT domain-containing protein [Nonomuraea terrae]|nr:polymorphic toxin-type HINT domain-containing protein [Nonomuraea terrae]